MRDKYKVLWVVADTNKLQEALNNYPHHSLDKIIKEGSYYYLFLKRDE